MKKIDWTKEYPEVPDPVHRSVLNALSSLEEQEAGTMKKKTKRLTKKKVILLAAALAALIGTTAAAAELFHWNERAREVFPADEEIQDQLTQKQLAQNPSQSVTDQGLTITALQTVQDRHRFYALFEVTAEDMEITEDYSLEYRMDFDGGEDPFTALGWSFVSELEQPVSGSRYFEIYGTKADDFEGDLRMNLHFTKLLGPAKEKAGEGDPILEGNWDFSLDVRPSEVLSFEPDEVYEIGGYSMKVASVELSPLSATIRYDAEDVRAMEAGENVHLNQLDDLPALYPESLSLKDGTAAEGLFLPLTEGFTDDGLYEIVLALPKVVDPAQAEVLRIDGVQIPLS